LDFFFFIRYSTLIHLPPLRFHCVGGCWDRTQDSCDYGIGCQTLYNHSARSHPFSMPYLLHILPLFVDPEVEGVAQWTGRRSGPGSTLLHPFSLPVLPRLFLSCVVMRTLAAALFLVEALGPVPAQPPMSNSCQPFT
jgi:hypothetical protein